MNKRFIESICFKEGDYRLLDLHQDRVNRTFDHYFKGSKPFLLKDKLPKLLFEETYKVRLIYDRETIDVEYAAYQPRKIKTLRIVKADHVDYGFKYEDRTAIHQLVRSAKTDDIIMTKTGLITDSSYSNLAFWDGSGWFTPEKPLLKGVKRYELLESGEIRETSIRTGDLAAFQKVCLINAMLELDTLNVLIDDVSITF